MWTKRQLEQHKEAAELLSSIKDSAFDYIRKNAKARPSEYEVMGFILEKMDELSLCTDRKKVIVAFGRSSADPHYCPKKESRRLAPDTFVLIDIWARLKEKKAPFADITWTGYHGSKIPKEIQEVFRIVKQARDASISYMRRELGKGRLPIGRQADTAARELIAKSGFEGKFIHSTGHSLGTTSPHGRLRGLRRTNKRELAEGMGYSVEPGIYLKGRFGLRTEDNIYITANTAGKPRRLVITTTMQERIVRV